jgi:hypothetical protein
MSLLYGKRAETETLFQEMFPDETTEQHYYTKCRKIHEFFTEEGDDVIPIFRNKVCYLTKEVPGAEYEIGADVTLPELLVNYRCLSDQIYIISVNFGDLDIS